MVALLAGAALWSCSDAPDDRAAVFVQNPDSRLIKVQSVGLAAFGPINPHLAVASDAVSAFGHPATSRRHGRRCVRRWPHIGLIADFGAGGGGDPCAEGAEIAQLWLTGSAATRAGWRTAEGIRPGMRTAGVQRIYPDARRAGSGALVLVGSPPQDGSTGLPVLMARTANGRVAELAFPIERVP